MSAIIKNQIVYSKTNVAAFPAHSSVTRVAPPLTLKVLHTTAIMRVDNRVPECQHGRLDDFLKLNCALIIDRIGMIELLAILKYKLNICTNVLLVFVLVVT